MAFNLTVMKNQILTLLLVLAISSVAWAQNADYAFKVLANKGISEVKSGETWHQIRTGVALKLDDEIKVADNSYIGLVHATGKPLELKQAGSYKVADLASKIKASSGVLNKYTDFILSSNSAEAKKNKLNATGAVHRGDADAKPIQLLLPDRQHSNVIGNSVLVSWEESDVQGPFLVIFKNMFDEELFRVETAEKFIHADLSVPRLANQNAIIVEVQSASNKSLVSNQSMLKKLAGADAENVKKQLDEMGPDIQEASALNKWILAGFYEQNKLYIDALTSLSEAHRLAPDVPEIKEAYEDFLARHGYKK
jgi:hypothetical protein